MQLHGTPGSLQRTEPPYGAALDPQVIAELVTEIGNGTAMRIMQLYLNNSATELGALQQSAQHCDLQAFGARLHSLKSSSKLLGGNHVAALAQEGEQLARAQDERAFDLLAPLADALDSFCRDLAAQVRLQRGEEPPALASTGI